MKRIFAIVLAVCLLAGCQLASEEKHDDQLQDKLVGVFVTFEHLDLAFDIEGWLNDNPGALKGGEVTLEPGEGMAYQEKLPVTLTDDGWQVPGHEGISIGRYWNGEYWTGFSTEGVCELNSNIAAGDDGDDIKVEGTVYFPADSAVMLCTNPVYQTPEGEFYVIQGNSFHSHLEKDGSMSQSVKDEKTWTMDGEEKRFAAEFSTTVQAVTLAEQVVLVWMSADHQELDRAEYIPGSLPESIDPAGAAYLIVEEIAGEQITWTLYQPGDDFVKVFYQGEHPWCLPDFVGVKWPE